MSIRVHPWPNLLHSERSVVLSGYLAYTTAAFVLGLLTAISPCPLAMNLVAISYVARRVGRPRAVIAAGVLYALGCTLFYVALAATLATTAASIPAVSRFLQQWMHVLLSPLLLLMGLLLTGLVVPWTKGPKLSARFRARLDHLGLWGALLLGVLFAAAFCPTSAAWFFGLLTLTLTGAADVQLPGFDLPAAAPPGATLLLPAVYGLGAALPVVAMSVVLAFSAQAVGRSFAAVAKIEAATRQLAGWIFILLGGWLTLKFVFEL